MTGVRTLNRESEKTEMAFLDAYREQRFAAGGLTLANAGPAEA